MAFLLSQNLVHHMLTTNPEFWIYHFFLHFSFLKSWMIFLWLFWSQSKNSTVREKELVNLGLVNEMWWTYNIYLLPGVSQCHDWLLLVDDFRRLVSWFFYDMGAFFGQASPHPPIPLFGMGYWGSKWGQPTKLLFGDLFSWQNFGPN